jgi:hypothetical protein
VETLKICIYVITEIKVTNQQIIYLTLFYPEKDYMEQSSNLRKKVADPCTDFYGMQIQEIVDIANEAIGNCGRCTKEINCVGKGCKRNNENCSKDSSCKRNKNCCADVSNPFCDPTTLTNCLKFINQGTLKFCLQRSNC